AGSDLQLQQALGVAAQYLRLVFVRQRRTAHPVDRRAAVRHEGPVDREQDVVDAHFHDAAQERRIGEEAACCQVEVLREDIAEAQRLLARALERGIDAP